MLDVTEAVATAVGYIKEVYRGSAVSHIRLEETELREDQSEWTITLSFLQPKPIESPLDELDTGLRRAKERVYKSVTIDNTNGRVVSMKIRAL